ncbi:hypothetical protein PoB_001340900 [Plakobranchus ocellatus]|uniref:Uncharacterized protein n=1 Tax=Plakobranchus ocellatus TaxID=259542 RepID=A0AAV3YYT8_9GAST|nr:hypothetical protein PoB_001340900 [Plakobranchus ocellatus]
MEGCLLIEELKENMQADFRKVALGEPRVAHPKPTHYRLPFSTGSFASPVEVIAQVGEHFVQLVYPLSIPIFLPDGVALKTDARSLRRVAIERSGCSGKAAATFSSSLEPSVKTA